MKRLGSAYFSTSPDRSICYTAVMTAKLLKDVLERAEKWPEAAQTELAQIALAVLHRAAVERSQQIAASISNAVESPKCRELVVHT